MPNTGPPSLGLLLLEGQRALLEGLSTAPATPLLRRAAQGDGQPVLVLPGFMASDLSTSLLRRFLKDRGFSAHPWLQGRNRGPHDAVGEGLSERLADLQGRYGRKVSIIGWSLGGIYAREIAKRAPDRVRQVISLGSPFGDIERPTNASRLFEFVSILRDRETARNSTRNPTRKTASRSARVDELRNPPPRSVPSTAIFTKTDGVVHWSTCLEPETEHTENIEVPGSHCGLGFNPLVLYAIADRLSQPEGAWRPFDEHRQGWQSLAYR